MDKTLYAQIAALGRRFHASRVVLYGSRARGDHRERSDIDLAVFGLYDQARYDFRAAVDELPTLLDFDVAFVDETTDPVFLANIQKDGVDLMNKFTEKYEKLQTAVRRLQEAIADYAELGRDSVRDGVIQRFEFCTELAWKTAREYLLDQGYQDINSPKAVMKQAYADGLVDDEKAWLRLLDDRNITSHIYDEASASAVFSQITTEYLPLFKKLISSLSN